jgi:hypothetical protein
VVLTSSGVENVTLKQLIVLRSLTLLSGTAMMAVATTGRDPLLFGIGLFNVVANQVGLFSLGPFGKRSAPCD